MKKVNKKKGFTLVELAIVIAVIAILAAILVPTLTTVLGKANKTKDSTTVNKAIQAYVTDNVDKVEDFEDCYVAYKKSTSETLYYHIVNASVSGDAVDAVPTGYTEKTDYSEENALGASYVVYVKVTTPAST